MSSSTAARRLSQQAKFLSPTIAEGFKTRQIGALNTLDFRLYLENAQGQVVSPFHDVPLFANESRGVYNMIVEIPKWSNAKLEISKSNTFNPVVQDTKKGKLRFVRNCFPHKGYIWNYGAFPQTWEDPNHTHPETGAIGDNDPLDVCEIGAAVGYVGQVKQVKILGVMALLDEGETDWKVIVIDVRDPLASQMNDVGDVEKMMPGFIDATREWFRIYKMPDGKPENKFAFAGQAKNKKFATGIISECHAAWRDLISGKVKSDISLSNTTIVGTTGYVRTDSAPYISIPEDSKAPNAPIDESIDKCFFVS